MTPEARSRMQAQNKALGDFFALPGAGRSATTTGPSVRNFVYNVKSIPGDFAKLGGAIGGGVKNIINGIRNPQPARGRFGARRSGLMNRALQNKAGGVGSSTPNVPGAPSAPLAR